MASRMGRVGAGSAAWARPARERPANSGAVLRKCRRDQAAPAGSDEKEGIAGQYAAPTIRVRQKSTVLGGLECDDSAPHSKSSPPRGFYALSERGSRLSLRACPGFSVPLLAHVFERPPAGGRSRSRGWPE